MARVPQRGQGASPPGLIKAPQQTAVPVQGAPPDSSGRPRLGPCTLREVRRLQGGEQRGEASGLPRAVRPSAKHLRELVVTPSTAQALC